MDNTRFDYGITFNGHHSTEFSLDVIEKYISMPEKVKNIETLPHSNIKYDFSKIYGSQIYEQREIEMTFRLNNWEHRSKESLYVLWTNAVKWLTSPSELTRLEDDIMPNYYYMAEVQKKPEWEEARTEGNISVVFTAYPFRVNKLGEGHDIWDEFNFELDVAQFTSFNIQGSGSVSLINNGTPDVVPQIIASAPFTIIHDGVSYSLNAGTSKDLDFVLRPGTNRMTIRGNGRIEFIFHQELI